MLNFYGFMIFICVLIILPILINIFDNLFNIFKILNNRISVLDKVLEFDNMELSSKIKPTLSSLEVSRQIIAKKTVRRMHEIIHDYTVPETIQLSPQIIERESTQ